MSQSKSTRSQFSPYWCLIKTLKWSSWPVPANLMKMTFFTNRCSRYPWDGHKVGHDPVIVRQCSQVRIGSSTAVEIRLWRKLLCGFQKRAHCANLHTSHITKSWNVLCVFLIKGAKLNNRAQHLYITGTDQLYWFSQQRIRDLQFLIEQMI